MREGPLVSRDSTHEGAEAASCLATVLMLSEERLNSHIFGFIHCGFHAIIAELVFQLLLHAVELMAPGTPFRGVPRATSLPGHVSPGELLCSHGTYRHFGALAKVLCMIYVGSIAH